MLVSLDLNHVQHRRRNFYYTRASITFSEEERAIIRERNLGPHMLFFEKGYVNHPDPPGDLLEPALLDVLSIVLAAVGALNLAIFLTSGRLSIFYSAGFWLAAWALYDHAKRMRAYDDIEPERSVTIDEIIRSGSFTLCALHNVANSNLAQAEICKETARIKDLLIISAKPLGSQSYKI